MTRRRLRSFAQFLVASILPLAIPVIPAPARAEVPAFPGAEGFGSTTPGGRGGAVFYVTSLADSGPGTLRDVLNRPGPRIIVFSVGGTIALRSPLDLLEPFVTIAGHSAPGGGITLRRTVRDPGQANNKMLRIRTHDVVVRHLRFRGGTDDASDPDTFDTGLGIGNGAYNVVVDHCSVSFNTDENIDFGGHPEPSHDITVQWSISSEVLNPGCVPNGPCPGKGGMLADPPGVTRVSIHHNLFASNWDRNPTIGGSGVWDVVNNVMYNIGGYYASAFSDWDCDGPTPAPIEANYVANYIAAGPSSPPGHYPLVLFPLATGPGLSVYRAGNAGVPWFAYCQLFTVSFPGCVEQNRTACSFADYETSTRHPAPPISETNPATPALRDAVVAGVGATRPVRDAIDACVANSVTTNEGTLLTALGQGCSSIAPPSDPGTAAADRDADGMPDAWELSYGFDPDDPGDGRRDADGDVYTNVEEYLERTDPADADRDGVTARLDNCPAAPNPAQEDLDADGAGDACDCAPADAGAIAVPGEPRALRIDADTRTLRWDVADPAGGSVTTYDLVRGDVGDLPAGAPSETCLFRALAATTASDPERPAAEAARWYLVRAVNACGTRGFGATSAGAPRASSACE